MTDNNTKMWQAKLAAFIHDPAEKALILLRGKGHERGTVAALRDRLFPRGIPADVASVMKKADHWASAADRPQLPKTLDVSVAFAREGAVIHPLTGKSFRLGDMTGEIPTDAIEAVSLDHFQNLIVGNGDGISYQRTFLRFWRFGPKLAARDLGVLWGVLPADTRSPDHSIWEHLKLVSAFAGAMAADSGGIPALLTVSFGPVQSFIAQARSVSDLWAGSHLLSRITWEGMKEVCERFGPDAVIFPDLHGVALVDVWLEQEQFVSWPDDIAEPAWKNRVSDANPLFAAALPNRFTAIVPTNSAEDTAAAITARVREWVKGRAKAALSELERLSGLTAEHAGNQIDRQLKGFPEVHWAVVPWTLSGVAGVWDDNALKQALGALGDNPSYLGKTMDQVLRKEIRLNNEEFYTPNPGVSYPGLYTAADRLHSAAKTARPFGGELETGYRCAVCGEREWITHDETLLGEPPGQRGETIWSKAAGKSQSIAKKGECLCALCGLKRIWPRLFVEDSRGAIGGKADIQRVIISTHTMAMATSIDRWLSGDRPGVDGDEDKRRKAGDARLRLQGSIDKGDDRVLLPQRLHDRLRGNEENYQFFSRLPLLLDTLDEAGEEDGTEVENVRNLVCDFLGHNPETYYALVLMDGDKMGAWLSGDEGRLPMRARFHETVRGALPNEYLDLNITASPARHQAISTALNNFALHLARVAVEEAFLGKLIYAGGDDLMAMVAVHDLPGLMLALRALYSGNSPRLDGGIAEDFDKLTVENGFALLKSGNRKSLFRLMGENATASMGAVVAHHKSPLSRVLGDLRSAERKAKNAGRDAFAITLNKRSGGSSTFVGKWRPGGELGESEMSLLMEVRDVFANDLSRRAAYILVDALRDSPPEGSALLSVMRYQFNRQGGGNRSERLAVRLASAAVKRGTNSLQDEPEWPASNAWLRDLIITAEFLAREGRAGAVSGGSMK